MVSRIIKFVVSSVAIIIIFNISGCGSICTGGECAINAHTPSGTEDSLIREKVFGETSDIDPASATAAIGLVMSELKELLGQVSTLVDQVGGEMRSVVLETESSISNLLNEMDVIFGDRLDVTIDKLDGLELRMAEDAQSLVAMTAQSVSRLNEGALETARIGFNESNILAYDALYNLPCRSKVPRLVYASPFSFRIWGDEDKPAGDDVDSDELKREIYITVRGNYLNYQSPSATVRVGTSGSPIQATVISSKSNEFVVSLPSETIRELQGIQYPTKLILESNIATCKEDSDSDTPDAKMVEADVTVLPSISYTVATTTKPTAKLPAFGSKTFSLVRNGNNRCDDNTAVDKIWNVGPTEEPVDWTLSTNNRCKSYVVSVQKSGRFSVKVDARVGGCGRDCFLGVCNCKGSGKLSYNLRVRYKDKVLKKLDEFTRVKDKAQTQYSFPYPYNFPPGYSALTCEYYTRILVKEGGSEKVIELTRADPNNGAYISRHNKNTCDVTVEIPAGAPLVERGN